MKYLLVPFVCVLSACGSGENDNQALVGDINQPTEDDVKLSGGGPNNPTEIVINTEYNISSNDLSNYFRYSGAASEKIVVHAELNQSLSNSQKSACAANLGRGSIASTLGTQIHIYDNSLNRIDGICGVDLTFEVPLDGVYLIRPDYQSTNYGSLIISSIIGDSSISSPIGQDGQPSNPSPVSTSSSNGLSSNTFVNYYTFNANAGQKMIISTSLDVPLSNRQNNACAADSGRGENASSLDMQIHVYNSQFKRVDGICGEYLEFDVPSNGSYILHFSFGQQSSGYFNATLVN